ncbi:ABC transporter permease [Nocardioides aromaticivorans]|uniref:ABC transporter permease n=1 Tax=Nocardioides aromaticivorans TaxID=200618 RepID=A0ABX7PS21_9ACTN|nr:ABC transporter permease [Nocardioides aromaticivorans]
MGLFLLSWIIAPGSVSRSSIDALLPFAGILAIAAVGQTLVVMLRGIDLSLPGMVTLGALISSKYAADHDSLFAALIVVGLVAIGVGLVNGIAVTFFSVTPLVATLAVNAGLLGIATWYTGGTPSRAPDGVASFSLDKTLGVSNTVWLAIALVIVAAIATSRTSWGRRVVLVGANEHAARAAGVRVAAVQISGYVAAALCYAGAGVVLAGFVGSPNTNAGNSYLLPAIAAVVVGGTALTGGRGSVVGSAIGALFLSQLTQLVLSLGAPSSTQLILQAAVIAVAVLAQGVDFAALRKRLIGTRRLEGELQS